MSNWGSRLAQPYDVAAGLAGLHDRPANFSVGEVSRPAWNFDTHRTALPSERPGPPEPEGVWEVACRLVERYEFSVPELVRAVYDPREPLLGRTMLLEGRFKLLRFYLGVRVSAVIDDSRPDGQRVWGWTYDTLEGHLERGRMSYEVVKHLDTGEVEFVITAYSQGAPTLGPIMRLGWRLFGRRTQVRFYHGCGRRLRAMLSQPEADLKPPTPLDAPTGLVVAPSDASPSRWDRIAIYRGQPG